MSRITHAVGRSRPEGTDPNVGTNEATPWTLDESSVRALDAPADSSWATSERPIDAAARSLSRDGALPPGDNDLLRYGDVFRRRWPLGAMIALIVTAGVAAGTLLQAPTHRAAGLLEIKPDSSAPVQSLFAPDRVATNELETQFGILRSNSLASRVARQLSTPEPNAQAQPMTALTTEDVQLALRVSPKTGSRLVEVSFVSPSPDVSVAVVNAVLDNYLAFRMEEAKRSAEWLGRQLGEARGRLEASENRLQNFLHTHSLDVMETGKGETAEVVNERIQILHRSLADAQADRVLKQSQAERARQQAARGDFDSPVLQNLTIKLGDLKREHARLSSTFHAGYPAVQAIATQIDETDRLIEHESTRIADRASRDYDAALRRETLIGETIAQQDALVQGLGRGEPGTGSYEAMKREVVTNQAQYTAIDQRLKDVGISAALRAANVGIVDRASIVPPPPGSSTPIVIALALTVGLFLGTGAIFLKEHLDTSVRSVQDVGAYLGLPTLAAIPGAVRKRPAGASHDPVAEAFAALRTAVLLRHDTAASRVLLVTSANPAEGKTTVSVNLASSLARLNHRVLLVDANMRGPRVDAMLKLPDHGKSLVDVLANAADWRQCVQGSSQRNLDVLTGASSTVSPADLISLPQMQQLMTVVSCEYDFVVIDSPAVLEHPADVRALSRFAGGVLLTVRQGVTKRQEIQAAMSLIDQVSGVVLNGPYRTGLPGGEDTKC